MESTHQTMRALSSGVQRGWGGDNLPPSSACMTYTGINLVAAAAVVVVEVEVARVNDDGVSFL